MNLTIYEKIADLHWLRLKLRANVPKQMRISADHYDDQIRGKCRFVKVKLLQLICQIINNSVNQGGSRITMEDLMQRNERLILIDTDGKSFIFWETEVPQSFKLPM